MPNPSDVLPSINEVPMLYKPKFRYNYSLASRVKHIISDGFVRGLRLKGTVNTKHSRGFARQARVVRTVFVMALREIVYQCMERDVVFRSPERAWFSLSIREKTKVDVDRILKIGSIYKNVNLMESEFKFYEFCFYSNRFKRYAGVRISHRIYQELIAKVNGGMRYHKKKSAKLTTNEIVETLSLKFPQLKKETIEIILREGLTKIHWIVTQSKDVLLQNDVIPFKILFYKPNFAIRKIWATRPKTPLLTA